MAWCIYVQLWCTTVHAGPACFAKREYLPATLNHILAIHPTPVLLTVPPAPQLDGSGFPNTDWCSNHPDEETHAMIADQLAAFVRRVAPGWAY